MSSGPTPTLVWLERLHALGHALHLQAWLLRPLCEQWELRVLNVPDTPANFPRRHRG